MITTINFRIDQDQKEHLQILADEKGVKISVITREIITDYLNSINSISYDPSKTIGEFILPIPPIDSNNL
ncbi:hypothetical protein [Polaribacter atrinae]|uniref:hypothetical protein n=1 Tax=Polaribacter atrinae TaxID=1333662 RepID=UPI0030FC12D3